MLLGRPFIITWMGPDFSQSHQIAVILAVGFMTDLFLTPLTNSLWASAKHRMLAFANITDAVCNLVLSIVLGRKFGLVGIALGTTIPLILVQLFWVAPYACRTLNIGVLQFVGLLRPAAVAVSVFAGTRSATYFNIERKRLSRSGYGRYDCHRNLLAGSAVCVPDSRRSESPLAGAAAAGAIMTHPFTLPASCYASAIPNANGLRPPICSQSGTNASGRAPCGIPNAYRDESETRPNKGFKK